jgi:hypothetical protein
VVNARAERWVWSWARFVANVHSQIRTAGEPIKDAGYRPHAVCVVQLHLALVGNTGKGARMASKLQRQYLKDHNPNYDQI